WPGDPPPPVHDPRQRPDPGARRGARRGARHARRAGRARRPLRGAGRARRRDRLTRASAVVQGCTPAPRRRRTGPAMTRPLVTLLAAACALLGAQATARADFRPGAPGAGDPFFPLEGNGGYDVSHYDLQLDWNPATHQLDGVAGIKATATQDLSRFDLDLRGFDVSAVTVNGRPATFTRDG